MLKTQSNRYPTCRFACSRFAGDWLFGKAADYEVVYNAIDLDLFRFNEVVRSQTRADLGLTSSQFAIGHVGRFTTQKNHVFLIDIFTEIAKRRDDAVLLLVGSGEAESSVKLLVDERGLSDRVKFLGQRNDVNRLYQAFDVFVLPSLYEGLGIVGVEAQASGLPCLLSDAITREVDVTAKSSFLPLDDSEAWVDSICALKQIDNADRLAYSANDFVCYDINRQSEWLTGKYEILFQDAIWG